MKRYFYNRDESEPRFLTDLAAERRRANTNVKGIDYSLSESDGGTWESIEVTTDAAADSIGRPKGSYHTLNTGRLDLLDDDEIDDCKEEIASKLCRMCDSIAVIPERILVVGLGNPALTPDSVGPKSAGQVRPTLHISELDKDMFEAIDCSEIAVICPDVTGNTGIEAAEICKGVARRIMPDIVIAIDSIATSSQTRLGSTIQLSDTGIIPGSGLGNNRTAINEDILSVPVIAIGVPTVIDSRVFGNEGYGMMVSPREIDEITDAAAKIIGGGINQAFGISPF